MPSQLYLLPLPQPSNTKFKDHTYAEAGEPEGVVHLFRTNEEVDKHTSDVQRRVAAGALLCADPCLYNTKPLLVSAALPSPTAAQSADFVVGQEDTRRRPTPVHYITNPSAWHFPVQRKLQLYVGQPVVLRSNINATEGHVNGALYLVRPSPTPPLLVLSPTPPRPVSPSARSRPLRATTRWCWSAAATRASSASSARSLTTGASVQARPIVCPPVPLQPPPSPTSALLLLLHHDVVTCAR